MEINWTEFTPFASFAGGVLIGLAAFLLWYINGRVMGVSGILGQIVMPSDDGNSSGGHGTGGQRSWRLSFVAGVIAAPLGYVLFKGEFASTMVASPVMLAVAGLAVGIGTAIGSGCTSGHGICGLSRISVRSLVATCSFVAAGMVTVFIIKHGGGL